MFAQDDGRGMVVQGGVATWFRDGAYWGRIGAAGSTTRPCRSRRVAETLARSMLEAV